MRHNDTGTKIFPVPTGIHEVRETDNTLKTVLPGNIKTDNILTDIILQSVVTMLNKK